MPDAALDAMLLREVNELPALLHAVETVAQTLGRVADLCVRLVPGCVGAGVSLRSGSMWADVAVPEWLSAVDHDQYSTGTGPCIDAVQSGMPIVVGDMATEQRWGSYGAVGVKYGVRSLLALPLGVRGRTVGAMALYSTDPDAFDDLPPELTGVLAVQAGAALANTELLADTRRRAEGLDAAMRSRAGIEQAKGLLMGREGCSADEAFRLLRHASQTQHLKLHEVAQRLLAAARDERHP